MEDDRDRDNTVYDFTPDGLNAEAQNTGGACDGWRAYARWLMGLKGNHRRGPQPACSVPSLGEERKKALALKGTVS